MKKLGIVITDGVGYRNFVLSDFLNQAEQVFEEVVILSFLPKSAFSDSIRIKIIEVNAFEEKFSHWFFRKLKEVAHLQLHQKDNFGIRDNLELNNSKVKSTRGYATRLIYGWTSLFHSEKWIKRYEKLHENSFKKDAWIHYFKPQFEEEKIDLLFFTHQRPPFIAPLNYLAQKQGVKTATFIFSWDNLASKGRMAANFNYYLVWNDIMKNEMKHFYPGVSSDQIAVLGTPQFEPYVMEQYAVSEEQFCTKFNLNNSLKTICYSCGDVSTSKNDELYIDVIATMMVNGDIPKSNFIVRTSPAEKPDRFLHLKNKYDFIVWNFPKWVLTREKHQEIWSQRIPTVEDMIDLRAILEHCDLNINMCSTMSLDFMIFDKPVINPVFGDGKNGLFFDRKYIEYAHYKNVVLSKSTAIVTNYDELKTAILKYLSTPSEDQNFRNDIINLQIGKPLQGTSYRFCETLYQWANNKK